MTGEGGTDGREAARGSTGVPGKRAGVLVREASPRDMRSAALLRWQWQSGDATGLDRDGFVKVFQRWADERAATHRCLVLARGDDLLGMGWLALSPRVPTIRDHERRSADIQAVYVVPEARGKGFGTLLVDALVDLAGSLGVERVTVHSSEAAVSTYRRTGFESSLLLLQRTPAPAPRVPGRPD